MSDVERFEQLWTDWLEGELDAAGVAELQGLLEADAALLRRAVELYQTHRLIGLTLQTETPGAFVAATMARLPVDRESFVGELMAWLRGRARPPAGGPAWLRYAAVAVAAACVVFAAQHLWWRSPGAGNAVTAPESVATMLFADNCRWRNMREVPQEGQRLLPGRLRMAQGLALLRFDSGAVAVLTDDAELEIESRGSARLHRGMVTVRASEEATGFTVRTPAGEMVDLGTEFAVRVEPSGSTELHVLEGAVERRAPNQPARPGEPVAAGHALRYEKGTAFSPQLVPLAAKRFGDLLRQAQTAWGENTPLVYEGFNYSLGSHPVRDGGFGWAGPWRLRQGVELRPEELDASSDMLIVERDFDAPWLPPKRGGMWQTPPGPTCRLRPLSQPIDLSKDAVYYFSLMTRAEPVPHDNPRLGPWGHTRLTFRSSTEYWRDSLSFGIDDQLRPQIRTREGINFTSSPVSSHDRVQFWVGKIAARQDGEDEIAFKVYDAAESADAAEPTQWTIVSRGVRSDTKLDLVVLTATGGGNRWFDEIRISRTWRSAVPVAPPLQTLGGTP
jgi:urease beta subunit